MPSSPENARALSASRLAIATSSPLLDRWMAGSTARRPMFDVLSTPQRTFGCSIFSPVWRLRAAASAHAAAGRVGRAVLLLFLVYCFPRVARKTIYIGLSLAGSVQF